MVNIGGVYYNLAQMQHVKLVFDAEMDRWYVELSMYPYLQLPITETERINIASWLSHHEWRSPVCAANLTKRHTETPE